MQSTIDTYMENYPEARQEPATISKYLYQHKEVFVFDPGSGFADMMFAVKDKNCNIICEYGGIAGIQTCNDWDSAKFLGLVWKDDR